MCACTTTKPLSGTTGCVVEPHLVVPSHELLQSTGHTLDDRSVVDGLIGGGGSSVSSATTLDPLRPFATLYTMGLTPPTPTPPTPSVATSMMLPDGEPARGGDLSPLPRTVARRLVQGMNKAICGRLPMMLRMVNHMTSCTQGCTKDVNLEMISERLDITLTHQLRHSRHLPLLPWCQHLVWQRRRPDPTSHPQRAPATLPVPN